MARLDVRPSEVTGSRITEVLVRQLELLGTPPLLYGRSLYSVYPTCGLFNSKIEIESGVAVYPKVCEIVNGQVLLAVNRLPEVE